MNSVRLPDLCSLCLGQGFSLRVNKNCKNVCVSSQNWVERSGYLTDEELETLPGLNVGLLCSLCLPTADEAPLRITSNMLTLLFYEKDAQYKDQEHPIFSELWKQLSRPTSPSWQTRFKHDLTIMRQTRDSVFEESQQGLTPSLEEYIDIRRDASGVMLAFDLVEFAEGLDMSDEAYYHPVIHRLRQDAIDIIAWSNDLASYSKDYYHRRTHNIVSVLMNEFDITAQAAVNQTNRLIQQKVKTFSENTQSIPSFPRYDDDIRLYVQGLRDWIVGYAHWIYETERYFGDRGEEVKSFGWIFLRGPSYQGHDPEARC